MQETQKTQVWALGWEDPREEGMATTPVFWPGESPWTEEPGGLWFIGLQRVRYNWSDLTCMQVHIHTYIHTYIYIYTHTHIHTHIYFHYFCFVNEETKVQWNYIFPKGTQLVKKAELRIKARHDYIRNTDVSWGLLAPLDLGSNVPHLVLSKKVQFLLPMTFNI